MTQDVRWYTVTPGDSRWIESAGGPLVFMHEQMLPTWNGVAPGSDRGHDTDYAFACAVPHEVAAHGGTVQLLVLGDEPDATSVRHDGNELLIVRWRAAPSEAEMDAAVAVGVREATWRDDGTFSTARGRHVVFDSACAGLEPDGSIAVTLDGERFAVATAYVESDTGVFAVVHRLRAV